MITSKSMNELLDKEFEEVQKEFNEMKEGVSRMLKEPISNLDADRFERMWCGWIEDTVCSQRYSDILWKALLKEWAINYPNEDINHFPKCCFERLRKIENPNYEIPDYAEDQLDDIPSDEDFEDFNEGVFRDMKVAKALLEEAGETFNPELIDWNHVVELEKIAYMKAKERGEEPVRPYFFDPEEELSSNSSSNDENDVPF